MYPRVHLRSTQPKLYFPKIMKFSHYNEYGVLEVAKFGSLMFGVDKVSFSAQTIY